MMTDAEGRFAAGAVRRKKLFLVVSFAGIVVAGLLTASIILVFSAAYVVVNLVIDLLYTVFDPRIRY